MPSNRHAGRFWRPDPGRPFAPLLSRTLRLAFGLAIVVSPKLAGAHAEFLGSKPVANATLATSPSEVVLTFSEGVSPLFLKVVDAAGSEVSGLGPVEGIDREVRVRIPKALPDGRYLVSFRVISGDSHPVGSSFAFSVGDLSAGPASANVLNLPVAPVRESAPLASRLSRLVYTFSLLLAAGAALFLIVVRPLAEMSAFAIRIGSVAAGFGVFSALISLGAEGVWLSGGSAGDLLTALPWKTALFASIGKSLGLGAVGLTLLAFALRTSIPRRGLLLSGAALIAASRTLAGHAASHEPRLILAPALFVHLGVAAFWLASLIALSRALQRSPSTELASSAVNAIARFSTRASVAVPLLLVAGGAMSFNYVWGSELPFASAYTWLLMAKGVLFFALLGLAVLNRQSLLPNVLRRLADGREPDASTVRPLLRSMRAEVGLIIVTVGVSTVLATTPPPARAKGPAEAMAATTVPRVARLKISGDAVRVELEFAPARVGGNEVRLRFFDSAGKPRDLVEASIELSLAARAIEAMVTRAERESPGVFVAHDVRVPFAGDWDLAVQALITDFDKETLRSRIPIDH